VNLQELLNSQMDFASLAALGRRGWDWWTDELSGLLPAAWRARLSSRPRLLAEQVSPGAWRFWRDGHATQEGLAPPDAGSAVGLLLPPRAVLAREVAAPRMPAADVRRMLALDIDRLSPLAPELIHFDIEVVDRAAADGGRRAVVGIVPRDAAAALLAAARARGLAPVAMGVRTDGASLEPRFNFLPAVLAAAGEARTGRARLYWAAAVFGLLLLNVAVLVGRDMADVARLRGVAEAQAPMVNTVLGLRRRVEAEERRRAELLARGRRSDPLRMLDALSQAVPPGAWVQHLEWNGQTLRIVGFRRPDIDMAAAIRGSGAFTNPRLLGREGAAASGPAPMNPFDITADARPVVRP